MHCEASPKSEFSSKARKFAPYIEEAFSSVVVSFELIVFNNVGPRLRFLTELESRASGGIRNED